MAPDTATHPVPDTPASNAQLTISPPQALSLGDGLDAITRALIPNYEAIKKLTEAERYSRTKTMLLKNPDSAKEALLEVGKPLAGGYVAKCYLKDVLPTLRPMAKATRDFLKINGKPDKNGNIAEGKKAITWEDISIEPTEEINYGNGVGKRKIKSTDPIGWGSYCVQILGGGSSYINTLIDGGEPDGGFDEGNANKADAAKPALSARAPEPTQPKRTRGSNKVKMPTMADGRNSTSAPRIETYHTVDELLDAMDANPNWQAGMNKFFEVREEAAFEKNVTAFVNGVVNRFWAKKDSNGKDQGTWEIKLTLKKK
jgi:hypothetical protein